MVAGTVGNARMKTLVSTLKLSGNPFEHYTAETEPNIADYAIRPPYLQAISDRVRGLSSFILFGDRGAGKSATRLTVYNEIWKRVGDKDSDSRSPFVLNLTDYSSLQEIFKKDRLTEKDIVNVVAFNVVEQVLAWLSSLEDDERAIFIDVLDNDERTLAFALLKGFYLSVPEMDRTLSTKEALQLLKSAWTTKSAIWASQRWESLSKIVASVIGALSKKEVGNSVDISAPAEAILRSLTGDAPSAPRAILDKLSEFVRGFGFSGISVLVDKVDETPATASSAESTARLIYPLLSHVQLMEVAGFSWIFFLWSNVKDHLSGKYTVRLDKLAHSNIIWKSEGLRAMVESRMRFYSRGELTFSSLFEAGIDVESLFQSLCEIAVNSPRELIKLLDTIIREHDVRGDDAPDLIDTNSLEIGQDKFALETMSAWFAVGPLQQVLRVGKTQFVNRDVQTVFKIGDQGARVKIKNWVDVGLVNQTGTAPSETGAKQAYLFSVADARVRRVIQRKLSDVVGAEVVQPEQEADGHE